ncbi:DNA-directed RNA polymerase subunit alpha C-terminal domain-containing protein [Geodermatophilus sp. DSM 44513]|uniref:DNA-directed RNA polymerase subunit alpha C-terminal domain-containing protein n=1 Tax=Geodermatophilus sp. DSM 44513 TaxID=1528104 RepID=UPI001272C5AE|nr:DNA-directed RNA polymerase subunit alpha C-terminal domain-containing protein [Geodermatophilus sp. DSM 44513]WNV73622.1 DNA-directed RNA polymerase subunit alpha C-terminal domain-containing protein [Geodermatophilus sp. DSM 44513]
MPTTSPGTGPAGTITELGLPTRAVTALTRAGITTTAQLATLTRAELTAVDGLGPGSVAAIRRVVPEPPGRLHAAPAPSRSPSPEERESPAAPAIPSFASLRDPRRRTTVDLIVPATPPPPAAPRATEPPAPTTPTTTPRPPDYADLWRLGVRVGSVVVTLPLRLTLRVVGPPARRLRQLLGA